MKSWYRITNRADTTAEVFLYDEVGAWGTSAGDFAKELKDVKASEITLRLNSPGGEVFDGLAIYSALKRHPAKVTVHVDGLAASITSVIAMAGDRILIDRHAQMMIHEAHAIAVGNTRDMTAMARLLDEYSDNIASIYAERAGGDVATWRGRMRSESWFSAKEAVSAGLADEVAAGSAPREMTASTWDLSIFNYAGRDKAPNPLGRTRPVAPAADLTTAPVVVSEPTAPAVVAPCACNHATEPRGDLPFDPDQFHDILAGLAFDAPAPPAVRPKPVDLGPLPTPPPAVVEPPPNPFDVIRLAVELAANDAPAPDSPKTPDPATAPGFFMDARAFETALRRATQ